MAKVKAESAPLPSFLQHHLRVLRALCRQHRVAYLYAVGSVLRQADFGPESDVDFLFAFHEAVIDDEGYTATYGPSGSALSSCWAAKWT